MKNRPERLNFFLVVWLTMFSCMELHAQNMYSTRQKTDFLSLKYPGVALHEGVVGEGKTSGDNLVPARITAGNLFAGAQLNNSEITYRQRADLYYLQSGFFCKREWELEKAVHIPFRFRLGSLAECNAMEGKR